MKQLLDFFPLLAFFITYYLFDVYIASGALISATILQIALLQILSQKVERVHWMTLGMVVVFGGLTIYFHDDTFIKWKVTIIYTLFGFLLAGYQYFGDPIPKKMLGAEIEAPDSAWFKVNVCWIATCWLAALLNYYIAFNFDLDTWVNFKVFGLTGATFVLFIATGVYLYQYIPEQTEEEK
ncbi:MAG: septation protein A [Gammaproteobacteria bacterium]|nr:septation protein A [Gammaproteobacteria bacterium]